MTQIDIKEKLLPILRRFAVEVETGIEEGEHPIDQSDQLIEEYGWTPVRDAVLQILAEPCYQDLGRAGITALYAGIDDGKPLENVDYFIALMFVCMTHYPTNHLDEYEATVWSLTLKLKKIGTNSDYDPLKDPKVKPLYDAIMNSNHDLTSY
jgi:hypothetical protein